MWAKGVSGNPNGRPKKSKFQEDFEEKCREKLPIAFEVIAHALLSDKFDEKKWATETLLDRGIGKPLVQQVIDAEITETIGSSVDDLAREVAQLIGNGTSQSGAMDSQIKMDGAK